MLILIIGIGFFKYKFYKETKGDKSVRKIVKTLIGFYRDTSHNLIEEKSYFAARKYIQDHIVTTNSLRKVVVAKIDSDVYEIVFFPLLSPHIQLTFCKDERSGKFVLLPFCKSDSYKVTESGNLIYYFKTHDGDFQSYWPGKVRNILDEHLCSSVSSQKDTLFYFLSNTSRRRQCLYPFLKTSIPVDTPGILLLLNTNREYTIPFIYGYYYFKYTSHEFNGIDYAIWFKKILENNSFQLNIDGFIMDTVINKIVAYVFVRYLHDRLGFDDKEIWKQLVSLDTFEIQLIKNNGDYMVFLGHFMSRISGKDYNELLTDLMNYLNEFPDFYGEDTLLINRNSKIKVNYFLSSYYGNAGKIIEDSLNSWLSSLSLFYYPEVNILIIPLFEKNRQKIIDLLERGNTIIVSGVEFSNGNIKGILMKAKEDYFKLWLSHFLYKYSINENVLPAWLTLGMPMFFSAQKDNATIRTLIANTLFLKPEDYFKFLQYKKFRMQFEIGDLSNYKVSKAYLSFSVLTLYRIEDKFGKGTIKRILEKSVSSLDVKEAFRSATGSSLGDFMREYLKFIKDTLYFYSLKRL